jgi:hypothetical protein
VQLANMPFTTLAFLSETTLVRTNRSTRGYAWEPPCRAPHESRVQSEGSRPISPVRSYSSTPGLLISFLWFRPGGSVSAGFGYAVGLALFRV